MKRYCEACEKEVETKIITKRESYFVCGEMIDVDARVLVCAECGEELFCEELDQATLVNAYHEYRRRHKLLLPEEIKKIREQYGLSQRSFARLLNWGDKTICRYENGSIQDKAHNSLLLFLRDPENMRTYLMENECSLDERKKNKLLEAVRKLEQSERDKIEKKFLDLFFVESPCEENGFQTFDYDKFCAMVLFFTHKDSRLLKTRLLRLLSYSDMISYIERGRAISGVRYTRQPDGSVPENSDLLFGVMAADHVARIEVLCEEGYEKHQVVPECDFPDEVLSSGELEILNAAYDRFKNPDISFQEIV